MIKGRIEIIMKKYNCKADIRDSRCSPHTLLHSVAVRFLRNGDDLLSSQMIAGTSRRRNMGDYDASN